MEGRSKHFSRSRDSYHRTADKTFTRHNASDHVEHSGEFDRRSDFEEYLKSQCQELVCEVEEYRHSNDMNDCTIKFYAEQLQARERELKQQTKNLTAKELAMEQLLKKYNAAKQEAARLKQELQSHSEQERQEKRLKSKANDEVAYLTDKLQRTVR